MEFRGRHAMADLIGHLLDNAPHAGFFHAVSLLEEYFRRSGAGRDPIDSGRIRLCPDTSLAFPPGDVKAIERSEDSVSLTLAFMSLLGASSPLPVYFAEYVVTHEENGDALRDFLTIFNHRVYAFFYRAWKKYRTVHDRLGDMESPFSRMVARLAGIPPGCPAGSATMSLSAYCGLVGGKTRSGDGLACILSDVFGGIKVTVENWNTRWAEVKDPRSVGSGARLGINIVAGNRIRDLAGKFRVRIGPVDRETFETFVPGTENVTIATELIRSYLSDPLEFDIEVTLQSTELIPVRLGWCDAALGHTTALGRSEGKSSVRSIVIGE